MDKDVYLDLTDYFEARTGRMGCKGPDSFNLHVKIGEKIINIIDLTIEGISMDTMSTRIDSSFYPGYSVRENDYKVNFAYKYIYMALDNESIRDFCNKYMNQGKQVIYNVKEKVIEKIVPIFKFFD